MDFTLMLPREEYSEEELAADNPQPHSHWCLGCNTEWLCWEQPGDESDMDGCPECDEPPDFLQQTRARTGGGMTRHDLIAAFEAMHAARDREAVHSEADALLVAFLRQEGYEDVAHAYIEARDRVGFWFA